MNAKETIIPELIHRDSYLRGYQKTILRRMEKVRQTAERLTGSAQSLTDFASGHEFFGLHKKKGQWVLNEWAPNASAMFLVGSITGWQEHADFQFQATGQEGVWRLELPANALCHGDLYRLSIHWPQGAGERFPAYARYVVQDPASHIFSAVVWHPPEPFPWQHDSRRPKVQLPLIYEAHVGMAQEEGRVGSYNEFADNILPRIKKAGYNTIQLMAIPEHPYYGSFGYHVSSFFAASSRFGTPYDLKRLVDKAHEMDLAVLIDIVHSHAVKNENEGLSRFDGTPYQYFHDGARGYHEAWDSRVFDYGKPQVLHFLLSNCRYWLDEFHVDGFRFDGVTSMLYGNHGLSGGFGHYDRYFAPDVDEEALTYLALANRMIHAINPKAITIAEDISGMPGLAFPVEGGGSGFDYRFAMGIPDMWTRLVSDVRDEDWPISHIWYELTNRRKEERTISYVESHDQALVGDKTLIFGLIEAEMYNGMGPSQPSERVFRGLSLHKMIRLITLTTAGGGYLNFMGNEFGHPEWIDFPREGNNWSYHYARRQWHLMEDCELKYHNLGLFDRAMLRLVKETGLLKISNLKLLHEHNEQLVLIFKRGELILAFNFHPTNSYNDYHFKAPKGCYRMVLNSDQPEFGGLGRLQKDQEHLTLPAEKSAKANFLSLYLPARCAVVLQRKRAPE